LSLQQVSVDIRTIRQQVKKWPLDKRLELVNALWNDIATSDPELGLAPEQLAELHRRLDADDANPDDTLTWESVKRKLMGRP
jgi:putative addiction module component (TIGR02574 family)